MIPPEERFQFFVYILESPSAVDLYHGRSEADMLRQAVNLNRIPCVSRIVVNSDAFRAALTLGLPEAMEANPQRTPVIHISAHGFDEGIELTNGDRLLWDELGELLRPVNKALSGSLFICMSTCKGFSGQRMAMVTDDGDHPFLAIVGNGEEPTWPETAIAFASFYHLLAGGHYVGEEVQAMCVASGNDRFYVVTAEEAKQGYLDYLASNDTSAAIEELKEESPNAVPTEFLKKLKEAQAR
jgi:hypothetical protein